jgi:HEAT repeat protein
VRRQILHALGESKNARAEDKLFQIARAADDADARRTAIHMIGEKAGRRSLELLRETVESNSAEAQVQMQAVHAISERPAEEAVPLLIKIAKTHPSQQVRKAAIHRLGESGDPRALEFFREVLAKE